MDYVKPFRAVRVNSELMEKFCSYSHINKSKDDLKKNIIRKSKLLFTNN